MTCDATAKQLPFLIYSELSFEEEEQLHRHLEACSGCRGEYQRLQDMHRAIDAAELEPDGKLLADCRRRLRVNVAALAEANVPRSQRLPFWFSRLLPSFPAAAPFKSFGALALIALGYFSAGYVRTGTIGMPVIGRASFEPVASRVRYVEPRDGGQVQIVLEETRQRVLSGDMQEEPIRRLLLAAARESADPGVRVGTMDLLKSQSQSQDVRRALIYALQHDPNAGVRLKALEGLRSSSKDPEIRRVLAGVLLTDINPGVRTQAVDLLTQAPEPALVSVLQELMTREENNYVRLKCQKVLHEMNASVETF
jgi:hypothetical protein